LAGSNGVVVVGVNSDESVGRLKGNNRPICGQVERAMMLIGMRYVDFVVVFDEDTPRDLIDALDPDIIVKGGDYAGKEVVGSDGRIVHLVDVDEGHSTSSLIERIKAK
jgi:D-beta-D-heptose 7-phosphate kinase/D-beta-D-heptose 1-phosphate adenosyltransferase